MHSDNVMLDLPTMNLSQLGFKPYFEALSQDTNIGYDMLPPNGTVDVFIGCRHISSPVFQAGVIGRASDLFNQKVFKRKVTATDGCMAECTARSPVTDCKNRCSTDCSSSCMRTEQWEWNGMGCNKHCLDACNKYCEDKNCKQDCKKEGIQKATALRNYYFYYSTSEDEPMGFTQYENIFLYNADIYDCHVKRRKQTNCDFVDLNKHRVSFYTSKPLLLM